MDMKTLHRLWQDDALSYIDVAVAPGVAPENVRSAIATRLAGEYSLFLYDQAQIARISDDVLRQTVAVADLQVVVAMGIGFLGILNSLLISVLQRTREIGVRIALGASRGSVVRSVLGRGVALTAIGLSAGLVISWICARALQGLLYGVSATDPLTLIGVVVTMMLAGLSACFLPARRATLVEPMTTLRNE